MNENQASISELYEALAKVGKTLIETLKPMLESLVERLDELFGETPRYILYEALHPRKKPRGSKRRKRVNMYDRRRKKNSIVLFESK